MHSENSINWLIADLAITAIGGVTVPIYTTQSEAQIRFILNHSESKIIIISGSTIADLYDFIPEAKDLIKIAFHPVRQADFLDFTNCITEGQKLYAADPDFFTQLKSLVTPDDLVTIAYTSGQLEPPKE